MEIFSDERYDVIVVGVAMPGPKRRRLQPGWGHARC